MERRSFLRNIALACAAVAVPFKWIPPVVEDVSCKGLLWHIQNSGTVVDYNYRVGSFTIEDFNELIRVMNANPAPPMYWG